MDPTIVSAMAAVFGSLVGGSATRRDRLDHPKDAQQA